MIHWRNESTIKDILTFGPVPGSIKFSSVIGGNGLLADHSGPSRVAPSSFSAPSNANPFFSGVKFYDGFFIRNSLPFRYCPLFRKAFPRPYMCSPVKKKIFKKSPLLLSLPRHLPQYSISASDFRIPYTYNALCFLNYAVQRDVTFCESFDDGVDSRRCADRGNAIRPALSKKSLLGSNGRGKRPMCMVARVIIESPKKKS